MSSQSTTNADPITKTNRKVPTSGASASPLFFGHAMAKHHNGLL